MPYIADRKVINMKNPCAPDFSAYKDKDSLIKYFYTMYLNKTQGMFNWSGLPDTIQQRDMELLIQVHGYGCFIENHGNYFVIFGSRGGELNQNYMPTFAIIANHYLKDVNGSYRIYYGEDYEHIDQTLESKGDCVIINNDPMYEGLESTILIYANRLAETYITRRVATVMSRYINVFVAKDADAAQSIERFLKDVEEGKLASIIDKSGKLPMMTDCNGIYTLPMSTEGAANLLTQLIECEQYDKGALLQELGLQANFNMKREAIMASEAQLNQDAIIPFIDVMLETRRKACERINKCFGLNVSVELSSVWKLTREAMEQTNQLAQNEPEEVENEGDPDVDSGDSSIYDSGSTDNE